MCVCVCSIYSILFYSILLYIFSFWGGGGGGEEGFELGLGFGVWAFVQGQAQCTSRVCKWLIGHGFRVWGLGFGVWGLGFGVWGLGFGVWGLGFVLFGVLVPIQKQPTPTRYPYRIN